MSNNSPSIDELRDSFNRVYHGPDRLRREYELTQEAERLGVHIDTYRRLYELRGEEEINPYPKPKHWWHTPGDWSKWVWHLPPKKKLALSRKGVVKLVQSGVILTIAIGIGRYVWEAPKREKLAHYQAWQMINSARGQTGSGGRIDALQDLNKDGVDLGGLDVSGANLYLIELQHARLSNANFNNANLTGAMLYNTLLYKANLSYANLRGTNLSVADLSDTNLNNAILVNANFSNADLSGAKLNSANLNCDDGYCTNFKGAKGIQPDQIKEAKNWQDACYDPDFRIKLGLPPQNPKQCVGDEPTK